MIRSVKNVRADNCHGAAISDKLLSPGTQRFFTATIKASLFQVLTSKNPQTDLILTHEEMTLLEL